ncbi:MULTISPECIES: M15 family metallopeptidase [Pseudanabaena]|uniref:Peptidase M15B and M15C DD-carboxypeptidase VanY/endolysin n=2 Tax=Pseudanabaena TaxID=1152 RepID=L8MUT2_9CYAN|nr:MULTISPECIES: M15 family metallopeptidase [Pseudanabaena]ELS30574.1 peptidase M15B and M15C DD-carboxypeptidase VanY/endolysin [Pseudanabaena biceps PCC 7429]MDG3497154.1 D-alanyl-D-alanine carboxypeptidase family protein [Pseudanabaena catenata USMAC16]
MPTQNDIPVAQRVSDPTRSPQTQTRTVNPIVRSLQSVPWWAYGLAVLAFLSPIVSTRIWFALNASATNSAQMPTPPEKTPLPDNPTAITPAPFISKTPSPTASVNNASVNNSQEVIAKETDSPPDLFGHHAYSEAPLNQLRTIGRASDGYEIRLREAAAKSYLKMEADAKADGVDFVVISGFRTIAEQQQLFFEISKQRNQTPAQRAKVSAPPGHSEHHTGYAMDIGDGAVPSANLSTSFEKTAAYQWLQNNAAKYGFEMSFPPNNPQGVMYEPWHWRFVGDDDSLATFYKQANRNTSFIKKP